MKEFEVLVFSVERNGRAIRHGKLIQTHGPFTLIGAKVIRDALWERADFMTEVFITIEQININ